MPRIDVIEEFIAATPSTTPPTLGFIGDLLGKRKTELAVEHIQDAYSHVLAKDKTTSLLLKILHYVDNAWEIKQVCTF
jgi:hypothetical protein